MKTVSRRFIPVLIALFALGTWGIAADYGRNTDANKNPDVNKSVSQPEPGMSRSDTSMEHPDRYTAASTDKERHPFGPNVLKASDLIGMKVVNAKDEDLGKVEDIVLNSEKNKIAYGVLSYGGFLGMGDKYFAVPWTAFKQEPGKTALLLNREKDSLKNAPGFDKNNWPDMANPRWQRDVESFYGTPGSSEQEAIKGEEHATASEKRGPLSFLHHRDTKGNETMAANEPSGRRGETRAMENPSSPAFETRRVSQLMGMDIKNPQGKTLGSIKDIAIDMREGRPIYGILSVTAGENKLAAVPWTSLRVDPQQKVALLNADESTLQAVAFAENNYPNFTDRRYASRLHQRFNTEPYWSVYGYAGPGEGREGAPGEEHMMSTGKEGAYGRFDPNTVTTVKGTIQSVPEAARGPALIRIKTEDGKLLVVHLAPRRYLESQNVTFKKGDEITVTGSHLKGAKGREALLATEVVKGDKTIQLRDSQGKPLWTEPMKEGEREPGMRGREAK